MITSFSEVRAFLSSESYQYQVYGTEIEGPLDLHMGETLGLNEKELRRAHYRNEQKNFWRAHRTRKQILKEKVKKEIAAQKHKAKLQSHGLIEDIGNTYNSGVRIAQHIDDAKRLADALDSVKEALKYQGSDNRDYMENAVCRLEDITALILALLNTSGYAGFMSVLHLYIRTHYKKSICKIMIDSVSKVFGDVSQCGNDTLEALGLVGQATEEDVNSPDQKVDMFKDCIRNWKTFRHGAFAKHTCHLINILTTFGFVDYDVNPLTLGNFELFRARAWDVQKQSFDFVDVIIDTLSFFMERGYLAFVEGDPSLLMYDHTESLKFEKEYSLLVTCETLLETGRLEDLKTEQIKDEAEFEARLENLIVECMMLMKDEKNPHAKVVYTNRLVTLKKLRSKLIMLQKESPVRIKPYGVSIYGGSAVGKSMINAITTKVLLQSNKFNSTKKHIVTLNDSDPYQSEFRTYHTAVTMDDFGNTKANKYESSPTAKIVDFLNNVPKAALSPIAELKGNVMIRPKLVTVTTNVKHLLAGIFSNEPVSILRRFETHLTAKLKPEWVDPETGGLNSKMVGNQLIPDAWIIDVQKVKIIRTDGEAPDDFEFKTILQGVSIRKALDYMMKESAEFYSLQESFVANTEKFYEMQLCEHMDDPNACPFCNKEKATKYGTGGESEITCVTVLEAHSEEEEWEPLTEVETEVKKWYEQFSLKDVKYNMEYHTRTLKDAFEMHKESCLKVLFGSCAALGLAYGALNLYKSFRKTSQALSGQSSADGIPTVLDSDHESNWKKPEIAPLPMSWTGKSRTPDQFDNMLRKRLAYCTIYNYAENKKRSCNIFPIEGNVWLLPGHMIDPGTEVTVQVWQGQHDSINRTFSEIVDESKYVRFSSDYLLVRLVKGGSVPSSRGLFLESEYPFMNEHVKFMVKNKEGKVETHVTKLIEQNEFETAKGVTLDGVSYHLPVNTATGMCIAPVYTYRKPHQILGFHLAGKTGTPYGVAGLITQGEVLRALTVLNSHNNLMCHSDGDMVVEKYGRNFSPSPKIFEDHAVHKLTEDSDGQLPTAMIYGSHDLGRSFFRTQVRKSPISDSVKKNLDIPRDHGPPRKDDIGKHWLRDLDLMAHPKGNFRPSIWKNAVEDLVIKTDDFLDNNPKIVSVTHPLAHDYVMSGVDGIAAYNRIPLNTSMGWPLNKKKSKFIGKVDREVPLITDPIDFKDEMFMEEIDRLEATFLKGERIHTVFRGNLKDEPTKWTKDKIRVFAGCEVAFTYLVRKYYLPIVRLIQSNWKDFECAVGINAHGPQWAELTDYVKKHGSKRIIAGDYAAFDKSASPEAMLSAFKILIHIAEKCGYSEEDLVIMHGIATEISYPIYEMDGVLLQLFGSNPSGHPLTVIINNIMNSLYMRYVYYALHEGEDEILLFHEVISLMCYGDDNIMSVSPEEEKFKMCNIVPILADVGIKYTKADKTAVGADDDYEDLNDVEFLKRSFVWNESFGTWTAALAISSIGKSLHNQMDSDTDRDVIAAQAIISANNEFSYHGSELFHKMQPGLQKVAKECGIAGLVGELDSMEACVDKFYGRVHKEDVNAGVALDMQ